MDELYEGANAVHGEYKAAVEGLAALARGVTASVAPLKDRERALEKIINDYGGDFSKLCDVVRAMLECNPTADFEAVLNSIQDHPQVIAVRKCKNRFATPTVSAPACMLTVC